MSHSNLQVVHCNNSTICCSGPNAILPHDIGGDAANAPNGCCTQTKQQLQIVAEDNMHVHQRLHTEHPVEASRKFDKKKLAATNRVAEIACTCITASVTNSNIDTTKGRSEIFIPTTPCQ